MKTFLLGFLLGVLVSYFLSTPRDNDDFKVVWEAVLING